MPVRIKSLFTPDTRPHFVGQPEIQQPSGYKLYRDSRPKDIPIDSANIAAVVASLTSKRVQITVNHTTGECIIEIEDDAVSQAEIDAIKAAIQRMPEFMRFES